MTLTLDHDDDHNNKPHPSIGISKDPRYKVIRTDQQGSGVYISTNNIIKQQ